MKIESVKSPNTKLGAIRAGQFALTGYRSMLKTKMYATDMVLSSLSTAARKEKQAALIQQDENMPTVKKESTDMKHLFAGIAAVAALGVALGAGYAYYKKAKENQEDYEELLYTDDDGEVEYVEVESKMDKVVHMAEDVKEVVASAAEDVADTMADAFYDVKEAINNAIEK